MKRWLRALAAADAHVSWRIGVWFLVTEEILLLAIAVRVLGMARPLG